MILRLPRLAAPISRHAAAAGLALALAALPAWAAPPGEVTIHRDRYGVPYIDGATDAAVAYGLGWAHAEDDFRTIQRAVLRNRGRLAAIDGEGAVFSDTVVHTLRQWDVIEARYESDISAEGRAIMEAYAQALTDYAAAHPDQVLPGVLPITGKDLAAGPVAFPNFYGMEGDLRELFRDTRAHEVSPGGLSDLAIRQRHRDAARADGMGMSIHGSNAFAIAPSRATDGVTRLVVNPHQPFGGFYAFYEAGLHSRQEGGLRVHGATFPGSPLILLGHNATLAWTGTVNDPDLVDIYVLEMNPENPDQYRLDGAWRTLERRPVEITVRTQDGGTRTETVECLMSDHGPVFRRPHGVYALKWADQGNMAYFDQALAMNKARTVQELGQVLSGLGQSSVNRTAADSAGGIARFYTARMPLRPEGWDWRAYLPGDQSALIWREYAPWETLPHLVNPASGAIFEANHSPFRQSAPGDNPREEDFPPSYGIQLNMTNRAFRAEALVLADEKISAEELLAIKFDSAFDRERGFVPTLIRRLLTEEDLPDTPLVAEAKQVLQDWDYECDIDNRGCALVVLSLTPIAAAQRAGQPAPDLGESFVKAAETLMKHHGTLTPRWGSVNRWIRGGVDLPVAGAGDTLRAYYGTPIRTEEGARVVGVQGDSYVMLVEFPPGGPVRSRSVLVSGQSVNDPAGPHATDQAHLYALETFKPVPFTMEEIRAAAVRSYAPGATP